MRVRVRVSESEYLREYLHFTARKFAVCAVLGQKNTDNGVELIAAT